MAADGVDDYEIFACCSPICSDISFDDPKMQEVRASVPVPMSVQPQDHEAGHNSEAESALNVLPEEPQSQPVEVVATEYAYWLAPTWNIKKKARTKGRRKGTVGKPVEVVAAETENIVENKSSMEIDQKDPSPVESHAEPAEDPNPGSDQQEYASWLPPTWTIVQKARMKGRSKGNVDKYYISPDGHRCRSKTEVIFFCKHGPSQWRTEMKREREKRRK